MENMLRVGVIASTHGVRGEVKVFPTTDDANRFKKLKTVVLDISPEPVTLHIESVRFFKNMVRNFKISMRWSGIKAKIC